MVIPAISQTPVTLLMSGKTRIPSKGPGCLLFHCCGYDWRGRAPVITTRHLHGNAASQQAQNQYQARHNYNARSYKCAHRVSPFSCLFTSMPVLSTKMFFCPSLTTTCFCQFSSFRQYCNHVPWKKARRTVRPSTQQLTRAKVLAEKSNLAY